MPNEILAVGDAEQQAFDAKQADANKETNTATNVDDGKPAEAVTPATTEGQEAEVTTDEAKEADDKKGEEEGYYFGDQKVDIEVPAEISEALKSAKIDEATLVKELFSKEGKFEVSEKTKAALDKAFGKSMVDGYLNLFRQQNQLAVDSYKRESSELEASMKANGEDFQKLVGGDEGWNELADWAGQNLSEEDLSQFNAVMQLPPQHYKAQRAVIEALKIKQGAAVKEAEGDSEVKLPTDGSEAAQGPTGALPATLTRQQFQQTMATERYRKDPKYAMAIDNIRRASQKQGIK